MRALTFRPAALLMLGLALALFAAPPASATAATPSASAHVATPAANAPDVPTVAAHAAQDTRHDAPAPPRVPLSALVGTLAAGAVLTLKAKDKDGNSNLFSLDTDKDDFGAKLDGYHDALKDETARPLQAQLTAAETTGNAHRDTLVGEIVRRLQLAEGAPATFNAEEETAFLNTLTPAALQLHFTRALDLKLKTSATTTPGTGETPAGAGDASADNEAFGKVHTS